MFRRRRLEKALQGCALQVQLAAAARHALQAYCGGRQRHWSAAAAVHECVQQFENRKVPQ